MTFWTHDANSPTVTDTATLSRTWSEARLETLKQLTDQGYTGSQIAERLGVSRSAVLGMRFRMKLPSRNKGGGTSSPRPGRRKPKKLDTEKIIKFAPVKPEPIVEIRDDDIPLEQRVDIMGLTNATCRWPLSTEGYPQMFCGALECDNAVGIVYCRFHTARAIGRAMNADERRELRAKLGPTTNFGQR